MGYIDLGQLTSPEVGLLALGLVVLWLALVLDARASQPAVHARARSRSFRPHARRVTRSSYMAHPNTEAR